MPMPSLDVILEPAALGRALFVMIGVLAATASSARSDEPADAVPFAQAGASARETLLQRHGSGERERIERGVSQVLRAWRPADGDAAELRGFLEQEFVPRGEALDRTFERLEFALERADGYLTSLNRDLRRGADLDLGPLLPLDHRLAAWDPGAHLSDDLFASRIAFVALLNFPLTSLDERLSHGPSWSRRQWAETRLAGRFRTRIPAAVTARVSAAFAAAEAYIASYNLFMHHVLAEDGQRLFPPGTRLLSHWNLRDEIKSRYADPEGLPRQRLLQTVMEQIVRQRIPAAAIDNPKLDWTPATGRVAVSPVNDASPRPDAPLEPRADREDDERYRRWKAVFDAQRLVDPHTPDTPSMIARRFEADREIPEARVKALLEAVLESPHAARVAALVQKRLGRPLEPFDIWYAGFKPRGRHSEADLDALTRQRYPTAEAYAADIPRLLRQLGFSEERARFLAEHIVVEPARGSGHAFGAARRDDKAHLRTRVGALGMDYKGYNIAVHEMGHNVEQVFSMTTIDHTLLQGVPNTAFTEAMAFAFQKRDLELLGLPETDQNSVHLRALDEFWATREIAAVALVDMAAWRWLYDHPEATPAEFREAVVGIAREVWNRHFAHLFGQRDVSLLGVYSHLVDTGLYLPDYPLGHLIAFQIDEHLARRPDTFAAELERMCRLGSIAPEAWMQQAVGAPLSADPLLAATGRALEVVRR